MTTSSTLTDLTMNSMVRLLVNLTQMMSVRVISINIYMVGKVIGGIVHMAAKQVPIYLAIKNHVRMLVKLAKMKYIRVVGIHVYLLRICHMVAK